VLKESGGRISGQLTGEDGYSILQYEFGIHLEKLKKTSKYLNKDYWHSKRKLDQLPSRLHIHQLQES
jgi:hypothetical protein